MKSAAISIGVLGIAIGAFFVGRETAPRYQLATTPDSGIVRLDLRTGTLHVVASTGIADLPEKLLPSPSPSIAR